MSKIAVKVNINSIYGEESYKVSAIFQDRVIKYLEKKDTTTKFDYRNNTLIRENSEFRMEYIFVKNKTTLGTILLKENNKKIEIPIKTEEIIKNNNNIKIKYEIDKNKFIYEIEEIK